MKFMRTRFYKQENTMVSHELFVVTGFGKEIKVIGKFWQTHIIFQKTDIVLEKVDCFNFGCLLSMN